MAEFPVREPMVTPGSWLVSDRWRIWLRDLNQQIATNPQNVTTPVQLTGKTASITTTAIPTASLAPGLYRISYYQRVTTAAGVSSSLTTTFSWTEGAVSLTYAGSAMTGNTTSTYQQGTVFIQIDQASPVTYATSYASNPASAMAYLLSITLEAVSV